MDIPNITIEQWLGLDYSFKYDLAIDLVKAENKFNKKVCEFDRLTFDQVSLFKKLMVKPSMGDLSMIYQLCYGEQKFFKCKVFDLFKSKKWLDDKFIRVIKREENWLSSTPDEKTLRAKEEVDRLNQSGEWCIKVSLAEQFGFNPREIGGWPYILVMRIQRRNTALNEVKRKISTMK